MTKYTSYQDRYFAEQLLLKRPQSSYDSLASAMSGVKVDLNPHQVDAALFAMQSPLSSGVLMADEVGLGKRYDRRQPHQNHLLFLRTRLAWNPIPANI